MAIGRRGTPRKLGVPGEDLPKVVYRLIDPAQYTGQQVLWSAAVTARWKRPPASPIRQHGVTLSYRGAEFDRAKAGNRERVRRVADAGQLRVLLSSNVKQIEREAVALDRKGELIEVRNDAVIVSAGGVLPSDFLRRIGISVETKYGVA